MGFDFRIPSTGKASPNDAGIVVILVVVIGESERIFHNNGGIIAQTPCWKEKFPERECLISWA